MSSGWRSPRHDAPLSRPRLLEPLQVLRERRVLTRSHGRSARLENSLRRRLELLRYSLDPLSGVRSLERSDELLLEECHELPRSSFVQPGLHGGLVPVDATKVQVDSEGAREGSAGASPSVSTRCPPKATANSWNSVSGEAANASSARATGKAPK